MAVQKVYQVLLGLILQSGMYPFFRIDGVDSYFRMALIRAQIPFVSRSHTVKL